MELGLFGNQKLKCIQQICIRIGIGDGRCRSWFNSTLTNKYGFANQKLINLVFLIT